MLHSPRHKQTPDSQLSSVGPYSPISGLGMAVLIVSAVLLSIAAPTSSVAKQYSLGVGVYPGDPAENFSPGMKIDSAHYRDLALLRPAYQSSAYDYNMTAQLVTDGIIDTTMPGWIVTMTNDGALPKAEREWVLDRHSTSQVTLESSDAWLSVEMAGNYDIPAIDSINLLGSVFVDTLKGGPWSISIAGSENDMNWNRLGSIRGDGLPGHTVTGPARFYYPRNMRVFNYQFKLDSTVHFRYYRFHVNSPDARKWSVGIFGLYHDGHYAEVGGPYHFTSAWKSASPGREWVYVDLGAKCTFNDVKLFWVRPAIAGSVQVSDDAESWTDIASIPSGGRRVTDIKLIEEETGRYVRVLMTRPADKKAGYILSELEVFGIGGPVPVQHAQAPTGKGGDMSLSGGSWRLQRSTLVHADGVELSQRSFDDSSWPIATVPATILTSYLNDGSLPDPNYADNQVMISDSYFYSDWWYRDVFTAPASYRGRRAYINFDGINWQADVYLNGHDLGSIKGAFMRGRFDVTDILRPGQTNVLAVKIVKNSTPGFPTEQNRYTTDANGGQLGADNPTFHASVGWDWIPTIRGRDTGIWNRVYLSRSGPVTIRNPYVTTQIPLPDTTVANVSIEATLHNHADHTVVGTLRGRFGKITFEQNVTLRPSERKDVTLDPSTTPQLKLHHPKLWWPNGYGAQNLYKVHLEFITGGGVSDTKSFETGVRQMAYSVRGGPLRIWVNGRRLIARGGNWGFPEDLLRYRAREYDVAVRYHKEMNFTMIRDWVGQTARQAFYDACDKYGIMVWQDFWLANPLDGPNPSHDNMFLANAKDLIEQLRNHPSVALYVGRNEGDPPPPIETGLEKLISQLDPQIKYIPNSADGPVSGHGPYGLMPIKFYFQYRATRRLHSEMGMPATVSYASLKRMMPVKDMWPQSNMWGVHDFTLGGAQRGASFNKAIEETFGAADSLREWLWFADWMDYTGYRAMFEAQAKNRMGLLLWMTHSSWPSLVWQTYDYYFDPTAAYFGCKEACQPLHIQWNAYTDSIEVVNYSVPDGSNLTATMKILNLNGAVRAKRSVQLNCPEDSMKPVFAVGRPKGLSKVYFISLELKRGRKPISRNFYWRGLVKDSSEEGGNMEAVRNVPRINLEKTTKMSRERGRWYIKTTLINRTKYPALLVKLKVVGSKDGRRILPAIYSDNFMTIMPGDRRTIEIQVQNADARGEMPKVLVEGFNVK